MLLLFNLAKGVCVLVPRSKMALSRRTGNCCLHKVPVDKVAARFVSILSGVGLLMGNASDCTSSWRGVRSLNPRHFGGHRHGHRLLDRCRIRPVGIVTPHRHWRRWATESKVVVFTVMGMVIDNAYCMLWYRWWAM